MIKLYLSIVFISDGSDEDLYKLASTSASAGGGFPGLLNPDACVFL